MLQTKYSYLYSQTRMNDHRSTATVIFEPIFSISVINTQIKSNGDHSLIYDNNIIGYEQIESNLIITHPTL
jgi:hypothetical protein